MSLAGAVQSQSQSQQGGLALRPTNRPVAVWLFAVSFLLLAMVVLGGVTRHLFRHTPVPLLTAH